MKQDQLEVDRLFQEEKEEEARRQHLYEEDVYFTSSDFEGDLENFHPDHIESLDRLPFL
jgi:hypothetical protein